MQRGAHLVLKTVKSIETGNSPAIPQQKMEGLKSAPKIFKDTCEINWAQPTKNVWNFIRGLCPYPGAWTTIQGKDFKIFKGEPIDLMQSETEKMKPGQYKTDNKDYLWFRTGDGLYSVLELQAEGKKRLNVKDFFRGNKL
jgi:methionyl-tRNA formyltransferase